MTDKARELLDYEHDGLTCGEELNWVQYDKAIAAINAALRTAPAIDLEQFRQAVACWRRVLPPDSKGREKAERLLALIDSQDTASAVPEGWVRLADIDPRDLQVECYPSASESSFSFRVPKGVKITHKSGASVICDTERSQHANRDKAMRGISAMLAAAQEG